jgi:hypothetical protein
MEEAFATALYEELVTSSPLGRIRTYEAAKPPRLPPSEFRDAVELYQSLSAEQKRLFLSALREAARDTLAQMLEVIQGGASLQGFNEHDFSLRYGMAELTYPADAFLNIAEEKRG